MKKSSVLVMAVIALSLTSCYDFNRKQNELDAESNGKAILLEAESSKKAKIEEAKAEKESAELLGEARIIEAKAKAKSMVINSEAKAISIKIESDAIRGQNDLIRLKAVEAMYQNGKFIYVPTEAGVPILEAGKR